MRHKVVYNACYGGYGLSDKAIKMLQERGYDYDECDMLYEVPRHNKDLIEIVEILGDEANAGFSELEIFELPEGCNKYIITDYDGNEIVETPDSIIWTTID